MSFNNTITGTINITAEGEFHCGMQEIGATSEFEVEIDIEADELDYRGFVVDVRAVRDYLRYDLSGSRTESGEGLAKKAADDLWNDRFTELTVTIRSADYADISYRRERPEPAMADAAAEEGTTALDPIEQLDNDDAAAFAGGLAGLLGSHPTPVPGLRVTRLPGAVADRLLAGILLEAIAGR